MPYDANDRETYYICHSLLKRGKGTCKTPRLNAKKFEKIIVDELRANILTESNIRDLVKLLDEEMDGVARDQRERLGSIDGELEEVKKQLGLIRLNCELFAGRSGYRKPVGDSRYTRDEPPAWQGWRLVRCKGNRPAPPPRLRLPALSHSPHYLRLAPVEASGTRLRDWSHSVAAIEDFPFPADRTNTLRHPGACAAPP